MSGRPSAGAGDDRVESGSRGQVVLILANDLDISIINAATGELLRELTIDLDRDYQPRTTRNPRT